MGDPAGIGPLVTVAALDHFTELATTHRLIVIGSAAELARAAARSGCGWHPVELPSRPWDEPPPIERGRVGLIDIDDGAAELTQPGVATAAGGRLQIAAVDEAIAMVKAGEAEAIVTGPVSKVAITRAGIPFTGHTEHLARAAGGAPDGVTMMFAGEALRVALVTTHLPLGQVPAALTIDRISATIERVCDALARWWRILRPRVVVLGLNPHAGEEGLFGEEEAAVIAPAIERARRRCGAAEITGPVSSEAGLRAVQAGRVDCAIAHYHDQATIGCKLLDMGRSVNVTLGLPFLRVSVDHGVAYDAARTGEADPGSMIAALRLAAKLKS